MYSEATRQYLRREQRKAVFQRIRIGALLLVLLAVSIWAANQYFAERFTFAWDRPLSIAVVSLVDDEIQAEEAEWFARSFLSRGVAPWRNLREIEQWLQEEYERHTGDRSEVFEFSVRGPVRLESPPPALPSSEDSFLARWNGTSDFLGYFSQIAQREDLLLGAHDVTLFVYFFDPDDEARRKVFAQFDSLASRRSRLGIVFAPWDASQLGNTTAVVAHELLHVLGATDKYAGNLSIYPEGYADPQVEPRFPQEQAEIMSLGIPVDENTDEPVTDLSECVVGDSTAREINWQKRGG